MFNSNLARPAGELIRIEYPSGHALQLATGSADSFCPTSAISHDGRWLVILHWSETALELLDLTANQQCTIAEDVDSTSRDIDMR